jgi:hypothetical protein
MDRGEHGSDNTLDRVDCALLTALALGPKLAWLLATDPTVSTDFTPVEDRLNSLRRRGLVARIGSWWFLAGAVPSTAQLAPDDG